VGIAVRRGDSAESVLDETASSATPPASLHPLRPDPGPFGPPICPR